MIKRRDFIKTAAAGGLLMSPAMQVMAASGRPPFRIGACDWSIDCRGELKAFDVAREIGLDGVQVSFGGGDEKNNLRLPDVRKTYLEKAADTRVAITSLAMGVLNQTPYASDPRTETTPFSPPSGPTQWLFQGPPAESKLLAATRSNLWARHNTLKTKKRRTNESNSVDMPDVYDDAGFVCGTRRRIWFDHPHRRGLDH
jgi:hypothetical protein